MCCPTVEPKKEGDTDMGSTSGLCQRDNNKTFLPGLPVRVKCKMLWLSQHRAWPRRRGDTVIFLLFPLPVIPLRFMQMAAQGKELSACPSPLKLLISLFPRSVAFH